jgi:hypothetical protein
MRTYAAGSLEIAQHPCDSYDTRPAFTRQTIAFAANHRLLDSTERNAEG